MSKIMVPRSANFANTPPDAHGSPYASPSAFAAWDSLGQANKVDMSKSLIG